MKKITKFFSKIIYYFSKSTPKTIILLLIILGASLMSYVSIPKLYDQQNQQIAEGEIQSLDEEEKKFLDIINDHRKKIGLGMLKISKTLDEAAKWMSNDISKSGKMSHTDSLGRNPQKRLQEFGYPYSGGENLAFADSSAESAFEAWLESHEHKTNMENPIWKAVGIGRTQGSNGWYWATNFGEVVDAEGEKDEENGKEVDDEPENQEENANENKNTNQENKIEISINLKVGLPGIGTNTSLGLNNNPNRKNRTFSVQFLDGEGKLVKNEEKVLAYNNGIYEGILNTTVPEGDYEIKLASDNSLLRTVPGIITVSGNNISFTLPSVTLVTGNISHANSENSLDIFDYNALLSCYGGKSCSNTTVADLNDDGKVDSRDLNILLRGFAVQKENI